MSNNSEFCRIRLMRRPDVGPQNEALHCISMQARLRAETFLSAKRRSDFLWARFLLTQLLDSADPSAELIEQPPLSPRIQANRAMYASISHTSTWIGVALSSSPIAIDLEVLNPARVKKPIFERILGPTSWQRAHQSDPILYFFQGWGLYECAVKLQLPFKQSEHGFSVSDAHRTLPVDWFSLSEQTLLTVCGHCAPCCTLEMWDCPLSYDRVPRLLD